MGEFDHQQDACGGEELAVRRDDYARPIGAYLIFAAGIVFGAETGHGNGMASVSVAYGAAWVWLNYTEGGIGEAARGLYTQGRVAIDGFGSMLSRRQE